MVGQGQKNEARAFANDRGRVGAFDHRAFPGAFYTDIKSAAALVIIQSPFIAMPAIDAWAPSLKSALVRGARVCAFVQQPRYWHRRHDDELSEDIRRELQQFNGCLEALRDCGIHVSLRVGIHAKLAVIDDRIAWVGSMNILSYGGARGYGNTEEMRRFQSFESARDVLIRHRLRSCDVCSTARDFALFSGRATEGQALRTIGLDIASKRRALGLTQSQLATLAGTHQNTVSKLENGRADVRFDVLYRVVSALDMHIMAVDSVVIPAYASIADSHRSQLLSPASRQQLPLRS